MNEKIENTQTLTPFGRICMTIGQLPASYVESMSYYEQLIWLTKYLQEQVIPVVNNNSQVTQELQEYVMHYFDNLDVQEEINNKLDEMAESGQLTDIIAQYLGLAGMITFDTVADMKLAQNLVNGSKCATLGYRNVNDGGKAFYKVRTITNDDVVDEKFIIALYDNTLIAELDENEKVDIKQLGAYGDGDHNDTSYFQAFATSNVKTLIVSSGIYKINDIIDLENKNLEGLNEPTINIYGITTSREHTIHATGVVNIKGINFTQTIAGTNILGFFGCHDSIIENCNFKVDDVKCNGYVDFYTDNHNIRVLNCNFDCVSTEIVDNEKVNAIGGIWLRQYYEDYTTDNIIVDKCTILHQSKDEAIAIFNSRTPNLVSNCQINNCYIATKNDATNPHIVAINGNNCSMNDCIIERYSTNDMTGVSISSMVHQFTNPVSTSINNCILNTNLTHVNGEIAGSKMIANNCIINSTASKCVLLHNNTTLKNSIVNCVNFQDQYADTTIADCEINISAQTDSWLFRNSVNVRNTIINFTTTTPTNIFYMLSDNAIIHFHNNRIIGNAGFINFASKEHITLYATNNYNIGQISGTYTDIAGVVCNNIARVNLNTYTSLKANNNFNINA